jgi:hypothetical protein
MEDALLNALVERRDGLAELGLGGLHVPLGQRFTERAQAGAHTAAVGTVDGGLGLGLTGALERRNVVCHCVKKSLILKEMMRVENADSAASLAIS